MKTFQIILRPGIFLVFVLLNSGCGTFGFGGRRQVILVTSDPPGAKVYQGDTVIAHTPDFIEIRAEKKPSIFFSPPNSNIKTKVDLKTEYRWKRSFLSNLVFFLYAPFGWATDLISGGAWEVKSPQTFKYDDIQKNLKITNSSKKIVAIAPPSTTSHDMSDQIGMALENKLKENLDFPYQILSYQKTSPLFYYYSEDNGLPKDEKDREELYYKLSNDLVLISSAKILDNSFEVSTELKDAYTDKVISTSTVHFYSNDMKLTRQMQINRAFGKFFYFFPNTLFINFGSSSQYLTINQAEYKGKITAEEGLYESATQVIERISLSRNETIEKNTIGHWSFNFLPDINLSTSRIEFNDYTPARGIKFKRTLISAGYGPRISYVSYWGSPYFDFIPHTAWTKVQTTGASRNVTVSGNSILFSTELGYMYYLNRNFVLKIFVRSISEDTDIWSKAFSKTSQLEKNIDSNSHAFGGISIGYSFGVDNTQSYLSQRPFNQVISKK